MALGAGLPRGLPKTTQIMRGNTVISLQKAGGSGLQTQVLPCRLPDRSPSPLCRQSSAVPCEPVDATQDVPFWWLWNARSLSHPALLQGEPEGPDWVPASQRVGHLYPWYHAEKWVLVLKSLRL